MIRRACEEDIPAIVELGREFSHLQHIPFHDESTIAFVKHMLTREDAAIFVIDRNGKVIGTAGVLLTPAFFNFNYKSASEMFWFVTKKHRGGSDAIRLFAALEEWAREVGASTMQMTALASNPGVGAVYERRGYRPLESHYVRNL